MTDSFEVPTIRRLLVTRQFALSYDRMTPFAARQLDRALKRLLASPGGASFAEIARLNARAAHRLRTWRWY